MVCQKQSLHNLEVVPYLNLLPEIKTRAEK